MKKHVLIPIIAAIVVLAIAVGGWVFLNNKGESDVGATKPVPTSVAKATPGAGGQQIPTTDPTAKATISPTQAAEEIKKSQEFANVTEIANFSKEDVQEVLRTANSYANNSIANPYFASGQWMKDGASTTVLDAAVGNYFTPSNRAAIKKFDTSASSTSLGKDVMPLVFFLNPTDKIQGHPACFIPKDGETAPDAKGLSCPIDGVKVSDMTYVPVMMGDGVTPGVKVDFSATAKIPVLVDGKNAYSQLTYTYTLYFVNNDNYNDVTNPNKFVIDLYNINVDFGKVTVL